MRGKSALLYTQDKPGGNRLAAGLRAAGSEIVRVDSLMSAVSLIVSRAVDIVLFDDRRRADLEPILDAAAGRAPVVALSGSSDPTSFLDLVCDHGVQHLLAHQSDAPGLGALDVRELVVTTEKILRRDLFGPGKYLPAFGVETCGFEVRESPQRDEVIATIQDYVQTLAAGSAMSAAVAVIVDELVTNAIYAAPRRIDGTRRYARADRHRKIALAPPEYVTVQWGSDGHLLVLSVSDKFGTLTPADIREAMRRVGAPPAPGAPGDGPPGGLGLYTVYQQSNQLVLNVEPGIRTEAIAILDISDRIRGVRRSGHSLHVFIGPERRDAVPEPISPIASRKVTLSESMRIDLRGAYAPPKHAPSVLPLVHTKATPHHHPTIPQLTRGHRLDTDRDGFGMDTTKGLLRGASRPDLAVEMTLRFLLTDYRGGVVYQVDDSALTPWMSGGRVEHWDDVCGLAVPRDAESSLNEAIREQEVCAVNTSRKPMDREIAQLTAGTTTSLTMAIPLSVLGAVRYLVYVYGPCKGHLVRVSVLGALRREVEATLARLTPLDPAPPKGEKDGTPPVPPYVEMEIIYELEKSLANLVADDPSSAGGPHDPAYAEIRLVYASEPSAPHDGPQHPRAESDPYDTIEVN